MVVEVNRSDGSDGSDGSENCRRFVCFEEVEVK